MFHFTGSFRRARRAAFCGAAVLPLVIGCPPPSRSQQVAPPSDPAASAPKPPAVSPQQIMASIKSPTDITPIRDGIRSGILFYATTPLSEESLRQKDGTSAEVSFTVPLTVDRVHNRLSVQALVNNRKVRLILDTGALPVISLNETTAHGIELADKVSIQILGLQGYEPATEGLIKSLTLGKLTLQQIPTSVSRNSSFYDCTLGMSAFEHYRVTLDFAANTMTLTRGSTPISPPDDTSLSVPFGDDNGYIFLPIRVLDQAGWAFLDSGSDVNSLSFDTAKAAAAHLPSSDTMTIDVDHKIGLGNTSRKIKVIGLRAPVPISMDTGHDAAEFSTTSQIGMSNVGLGLESSFHTKVIAELGFPFLLQFQRVIIDYPSQTLILQHPAHNTFIKVALSPTDHDKLWPGYKWRQVGYAWIEVPDGKSALAAPVPGAYPPGTTVLHTTTTTINNPTINNPTINNPTINNPTTSNPTTSTTTNDIVVLPAKNGSITVTVNGIEAVYPFLAGSTVKVGKNGSVHILPPGSIVTDEHDGSVFITPVVPDK